MWNQHILVFGENSVRQNFWRRKFRSAKFPFGKNSFGENSVGENSFGENSGHVMRQRNDVFLLKYHELEDATQYIRD